MKIKPLNTREKDLLKHCITAHAPGLINDIDHLDELSIEKVNEIRNVVGSELVSKGFKEDDEPNSYGLELEDLIDRLADIYIWPREKIDEI